MKYDDLLDLAIKEGIEVNKWKFKDSMDGLYFDGTIAISDKLETEAEKRSTMAEELGHFYKTSGNALSKDDIVSVKEEIKGCRWGVEKLIPLDEILAAYKYGGITNKHELADRLNVTEEFIDDTIKHYKAKHGLFSPPIGCYIIQFEPLQVIEHRPVINGKVNFDE